MKINTINTFLKNKKDNNINIIGKEYLLLSKIKKLNNKSDYSFL